MPNHNERSVQFNKKLFNPIYWHIKDLMADDNIRYIWIYGGSSASKTFSVVQWCIIEMLAGTNNNNLILRKVGADIKDSIYSDFKTIVTEWNLHEFFIFQQMQIKCTTGSYTRFRGLDDPERIKGISGYKKVILEEISQFDEADYKQIRKRLRGLENQQMIGIFNPISEDHWIKKSVFDKDVWKDVKANIKRIQVSERGNTAILQTNYKDNQYIVGPAHYDRHVIEDFERDKELDYEYYMIYAEGEWGQIKTGKEYYPLFTTKNIEDYQYNPELPLHITYDFNVMPYMTLLVFQIVGNAKGFTCHGIEEICLTHPFNSTSDVTKQFCTKYKNHKPQIFVYGDYSGRGKISGGGLAYKNEMMDHQFDIVKAVMKEYKLSYVDRVIPNRAITKRRDFMLEILSDTIPIKFRISHSMINTRSDFMFLKQGPDGLKFKQKVKDDVTKALYEKYGHASDAVEYLLTSAFENEFETYR